MYVYINIYICIYIYTHIYMYIFMHDIGCSSEMFPYFYRIFPPFLLLKTMSQAFQMYRVGMSIQSFS